jgi:hypothetical protein
MTMQEYTTTDLFRLARAELLRLDHQTTIALLHLSDFAEDRTIALINQRRIRRELGGRDCERYLAPR